MMNNRVVFLGLFISIASFSRGQPVVSSGNRNLTDGQILPVVAGESFDFSCSTAIPGSAITLQTDPTNLQSYVVVSGSPAMRQYSLPNVQRSYSDAEITCSDDVEALSFRLNVQFATIMNLTNGSGAVGDSVNITFTIEANPQVDVPGGITVYPSKHAEIVNDSSLITIVYDYLETDDDGLYTLTVGNSVVNATATFALDVFFGPIFTQQKKSISLTVGERLVINCSIEDSNPTVTSIQITDGGNLNLNITSQQYYAVESVTLSENGTTYTCTADNGETNNSTMFFVTVTEMPPSTPGTPTDTSSPISSPSMSPTIGESTDNSFPVGGIIGIVIGVLFIIIGVGIIVAVVAFVCKKSTDKA